MATLSYEVSFGGWQRALGAGLQRARNMRPALTAVGEVMVGITRRNMDDGGGPIVWPDLAPSTLINRARHPNGPETGSRPVFSGRRSVGPATGREAGVLSHAGRVALRKAARAVVETAKPLIWTRALYRSIRAVVGSDYVDTGSDMVKSWTLFLGSRAGKTPKVPARNPFGRTSADNASIGAIFVRYLFGPLIGASS